MLFKTTSIGAQYASLHPALRRALTELDGIVAGWGLPEITLTEAMRTRADNTAIYTAQYLSDGMSREDAEKKAAHRFSYHLCLCAADYRSSGLPYSAEQWDKIQKRLKAKYQKPLYEVLVHDVGIGLHGHLAICDFSWRKKFEQQEATAKRLGGVA